MAPASRPRVAPAPCGFCRPCSRLPLCRAARAGRGGMAGGDGAGPAAAAGAHERVEGRAGSGAGRGGRLLRDRGRRGSGLSAGAAAAARRLRGRALCHEVAGPGPAARVRLLRLCYAGVGLRRPVSRRGDVRVVFVEGGADMGAGGSPRGVALGAGAVGGIVPVNVRPVALALLDRGGAPGRPLPHGGMAGDRGGEIFGRGRGGDGLDGRHGAAAARAGSGGRGRRRDCGRRGAGRVSRGRAPAAHAGRGGLKRTGAPSDGGRRGRRRRRRLGGRGRPTASPLSGL